MKSIRPLCSLIIKIFNIEDKRDAKEITGREQIFIRENRSGICSISIIVKRCKDYCLKSFVARTLYPKLKNLHSKRGKEQIFMKMLRTSSQR